MKSPTEFVDVILPLALPRMLTYRVPVALEGLVFVGQRVVVQVGKNKLYTAIIHAVHHTAPAGYNAKYVESILDDHPIVSPLQLEFWTWMSQYYGCQIGEVLNAALPAGLKLSSETQFILTAESADSDLMLDEHEQTIVNALFHRKKMTLEEISDLLEIRQVQPFVKSLLQKGIIASEEELREKFKPKTTDFIYTGSACDTEEKMSNVFAELEKRKAIKQSNTLLAYLRLAGWDNGKAGEVTRMELQKTAGINSSVIEAMVEKNIFRIETRETGRLAKGVIATNDTRALSDAQHKALAEIEQAWLNKDVVLLHGITSGGKTEVYARLIEQTIAQGKQVLFLLPEIALTTQIIQRLSKYFGARIGVYHSGYSSHQRTEVWNKVLSDVPGECDVVLGARSALFLPFSRLGLVIVDEEHEPSFKQHDPAPRYHARDAAIWLAHRNGAKVLLGSATPAVETYWNALKQKFALVELMERYGGMELPLVELSDLRIEHKKKSLMGHLGSALYNGMLEALGAGKQVILFQNRRGYTPLLECSDCGYTPMCTRCDVSLTYHKQQNELRCHYCGYRTAPIGTCNSCGSHDMRMLGFGTEKIEDDLAALMPEVSTQRMDLDTTRSKTGYQKIIADFESGKTQVLIGTQMVTKGLDFDKVALVGILSADRMLHYPDFRSMERAFQLMMQVAGRSGRSQSRGKVIIQTYDPTHWLLGMVIRGEYKTFYEHEIMERQQFGYPPFVRLLRITLKNREDEAVELASRHLQKALLPLVGDRILGPEKPYIPRINNYYLRQMLIKLERKPDYARLKQQIFEIIAQLQAKELKNTRVVIDVDPL